MNRERAIDNLRDICKLLKLADEDDLADKVLCALAAETDAKEPKAHLSYTYVMRKLRKRGSLEEPDKIALMHAVNTIGFEDNIG